MITPAQRKAAERDRKRSAGLVPLEVWTRPEHKAAIQKYTAKKNKPAVARQL